LPLGGFEHDRVGERNASDGVVVAQSLRPDQRFVAFFVLGPRPLAPKDLDEDAPALAVVPDAVDLVREGEVNGSDLAILDIAKNVGKGLARCDVDSVESATGIASRTDLEALRETLADKFGDEGEDMGALRVVDAEEGGGGDGAGRDGIVERGVLVLENFGGWEVVGSDGKTSSASKGPERREC
jgi:RNase P/RNase MRP subunit POP5